MRIWLVVLVLAFAGCTNAPAQHDDQALPAPESTKDTAMRSEPEPTSTGQPAAPDPPTSEAPAPKEPITHQLNGSWDQEAASWLAGPSDEHRLSFEPRNGSSLLVELWWNDTTQDLDPMLNATNNCRSGGIAGSAVCATNQLLFDGSGGTWWHRQGAPGDGDVGARIALDNATVTTWRCQDTCIWSAYAYASSIATAVQWTLYVTDYPGALPEGYTAIGK